MIPFRKAAKLPPETVGVDFDLEYGTDRIEVNPQTISPGARIVIVDDVLATGGTAAAAVKLAEKAGARVQAVVFVIELEALQGRAAMPGVEVRSLLKLVSRVLAACPASRDESRACSNAVRNGARAPIQGAFSRTLPSGRRSPPGSVL